MQVVPFANTTVREVTMRHGIGRVVFNDYIGQGHQVLPGPQAYLVNQVDEGSEIYPHFHDVDQFQIFISGGGRIGTHSTSPISAHYVDAYAPYGPIVAGPKGLSYLALRLAAASGGWKMPENRHLIVGGPGRRITFQFDQYDAISPEAGSVHRKDLWGPASDGLGIAAIHMGPQSTCIGSEPAGGQYVLVTAGALVHEGSVVPQNSLLFLERGESAPTFTAAAKGAVLLVMQFPFPSERAGSDPQKLNGRPTTYTMPPGNDS